MALRGCGSSYLQNRNGTRQVNCGTDMDAALVGSGIQRDSRLGWQFVEADVGLSAGLSDLPVRRNQDSVYREQWQLAGQCGAALLSCAGRLIHAGRLIQRAHRR